MSNLVLKLFFSSGTFRSREFDLFLNILSKNQTHRLGFSSRLLKLVFAKNRRTMRSIKKVLVEAPDSGQLYWYDATFAIASKQQ